jgi:hypothetical protein
MGADEDRQVRARCLHERFQRLEDRPSVVLGVTLEPGRLVPGVHDQDAEAVTSAVVDCGAPSEERREWSYGDGSQGAEGKCCCSSPPF